MIPMSEERFEEEKDRLHKIIDQLANELSNQNTQLAILTKEKKDLQFIVDALDERVTDLEDKLEL
jgi:chromosome segregation ATPase